MRTDHINAIELTPDLIGRPIEATVMFTDAQAKIANTSVMIDGEKREISEADRITIGGTIMGVNRGWNGGRAASIVWVRVHSYNGEFREFRDHEFVWGSHVTVDVTDPLDEENSDESTMADDLMAMFGQPESDGPMCEADFDSCTAVATRVGLLQVRNPDFNIPGDKGEQRNVLVCEYHADRWGRLWGTWPIENDAEHGVAYGGTGVVSKIERQRELGEISEVEYDGKIEDIMGRMTDPEGISLAKGGVRDMAESKPIGAAFVTVGMVVKIGDMVGEVIALDPMRDKRGRLGIYLADVDTGEIRKHRVRPAKDVTRYYRYAVPA